MGGDRWDGRPARHRRPGRPPYPFLLVLAAFLACARIEPPPGGPPDKAAPRLIATSPDSLAVLPKFDGAVEFQFDEVISEGGSPSEGAGTGDLERLIVLSPSERVPEVSWRRNRIAVRPRGGWRPNTVYRVELLPGVADIRQNRGSSEAVVTFTTGAPAPTTTLSGKVFDWTTARPAAGALVSAVLLPDTLAYRAAADSSGSFKLGPLPQGEYVVYGVIDQNRNLRRDPREQFDSLRIRRDSTAVGELWTFPHDTVGPRIQMIAPSDSLTAAVTFSQPLDPRQRIAPSAARIYRLPDSTTALPVRSLLPQEVHDSVYREGERPPPRQAPPPPRAREDSAARRQAPADSAARRRAPADSAPAGEGRAPAPSTPTASRPPLYDRLILRVPRAFSPGARYLLEVKGVRNVNRVAANVRGALAIPDAPKPTPSDSARPRPRTDAPAPKRPPADSVAPKRPSPSPRRASS